MVTSEKKLHGGFVVFTAENSAARRRPRDQAGARLASRGLPGRGHLVLVRGGRGPSPPGLPARSRSDFLFISPFAHVFLSCFQLWRPHRSRASRVT